MPRFISGFFGVALSFIFAYSWNWAGLLKERNLIEDSSRLWILLSGTILFIVDQAYLRLPKPVDRGEVESRRDVIKHYLDNFIVKYYEHFPNNHIGQLPVVRVNIMLPTKILRGMFRSYLKIYYSACPPHNPPIIYNSDELLLKWYKKQGTCGWAWKHGDQCLYDSREEKLSQHWYSLNKRQAQVLSKINSTLSTPIRRNGNIVAVLNMDSMQPIGETGLKSNEVCELARLYARELAGVCFQDGVAN